MRFLIDVDGVVAGCMILMVKEINERFRTVTNYDGTKFKKTQLKYEQITDFRFFNPDNGILTPGECKFATENFARAQFAYDMPVEPGSVEGIRKIREAGHEVVFLTAQWGSSVDWCYSRVKWLEQHFDAHIDDIIFAHRKELVSGDVLIDDKGSTCQLYAVENPDSLVLMMDQPWNQEEPEGPENMIRFNWADIDHILESQ